MNKNTRRLAKKAGFIFWTGERYSTGEIDWSSIYDLELEEFERLVRRDEAKRCAQICEQTAETAKTASTEAYWWLQECEADILVRRRSLKKPKGIEW